MPCLPSSRITNAHDEMLVEFPATGTYATNLGRLRQQLKPHIRDLHIRKRPSGVHISGPAAKLASAMLIMPDGYVARWL